MYQRRNAVGVLDGIEALLEGTSHKNVAREQRFGNAPDPGSGRSLKAEGWIKHFQTEVLAKIGSGYVVVLWFCSDTIPSLAEQRRVIRVTGNTVCRRIALRSRLGDHLFYRIYFGHDWCLSIGKNPTHGANFGLLPILLILAQVIVPKTYDVVP